MHAKKLISACTNSASGTHHALVGARSKCHLHIEQPAGLAQHADTPSAQVQTLRASRSMRACCGLHAGVSACCAKSHTQAKRDPCARGVGAYPSPRPRGGAIGVRACPSLPCATSCPALGRARALHGWAGQRAYPATICARHFL